MSFYTFDDMIATVGKQPMPILQPLLEYAPAQAYLIATSEVAAVAQAIRRAAQSAPQLSATRVTILEQVSPYVTEETRNRCAEVLARARSRNREVVVNISGGTTPMAMGAQQAARAVGAPMLYVNTDDGELIHLGPDGAELERTTIASTVSIELYVRAHAAEMRVVAPWGSGLAAQEPFLSAARAIGELGEQSARLMDAIRAHLKGQPFTRPNPPPGEAMLLDTLVRAGLLEPLPGQQGQPAYRVGAAHEHARSFLEGHWLEAYVADACARSGLFDEVRCGVKLVRDDGTYNVENELDVVVTSRGRFAAISCKTGKDVREKNKDKQEARRLAVFELDALLQADLMGLYARKALVTNQPMFEDELFKRAYFSQTCRIVGGRLREVAQIVFDHLRTPQFVI